MWTKLDLTAKALLVLLGLGVSGFGLVGFESVRAPAPPPSGSVAMVDRNQNPQAVAQGQVRDALEQGWRLASPHEAAAVLSGDQYAAERTRWMVLGTAGWAPLVAYLVLTAWLRWLRPPRRTIPSQ